MHLELPSAGETEYVYAGPTFLAVLQGFRACGHLHALRLKCA